MVDAVQFLPDHKPWPEGVFADSTSPTGYRLTTLESTAPGFEVTPGDWIITGVAGERWACKDEIFRQTYEPHP